MKEQCRDVELNIVYEKEKLEHFLQGYENKKL